MVHEPNNLTFTAVLVAVLVATQGISVLLRNSRHSLNRSFAFFCATVFLVNVGAALVHLDEQRFWHVLHLVAAIASAPAAVFFFRQLLGREQERGASMTRLVVPLAMFLTGLVIFVYNPAIPGAPRATPILDSLYARWQSYLTPAAVPSEPGTSAEGVGSVYQFLELLLSRPAEITIPFLCGTYIFSCYSVILLSVLERRKNATGRLGRVRFTLLACVGALTVLANFLQSSRAYLHLPATVFPIGGLFQLVFFALLSQVILHYRLLDLHEIISKGLIFISQALVLGGVYSLLLAMFGDRKDWVNLAITIFLASGVVSLFHEPLRRLIERVIQRLFLYRRFLLMVRLNALERELPRFLSVDALLDALMDGLSEVPRITHAAVYLWDERTREYSCVRRFGPEGWPPPGSISTASNFVREMVSRAGPLEHQELDRDMALEHRRQELLPALGTLKKLEAEVAVPFTSDGLLFGFLLLKDNSLHEGFTFDELDLLKEFGLKASVILQNSDTLQRMKERDRLAALGEMAAGLAHEIRNPLGAIRGAAQYLQEDDHATVDKEFLAIIIEEVDRLNKVVSEFLDYSRPLKTRLELFDLGKLVQQSVQLMETQGIPSAIRIDLELDPQLPPALIDLEKMKQVLLNLMQNAVQAMPDGGRLTLQTRKVSRWIWAGARQARGMREVAELVITDTGAGMAPDQLEKLFIPFFTTKSGGTGLGLAICQRLVRAHEGEMEVKSTPGSGSQFIVRLPLPSPPPATHEPSPFPA